jgi:hypothetical protein
VLGFVVAGSPPQLAKKAIDNNETSTFVYFIKETSKIIQRKYNIIIQDYKNNHE